MPNRLVNIVVVVTLSSVMFSAGAQPRGSAMVKRGEPLIYVREESSTAGAVIRFVEQEGQEVVIRLVPMDGAGNDLGSGKIVAMRAGEAREIRLDKVFMGEARSAVGLRVETRSGEGVASVTTNDSRLRTMANSSRRRAVGRPAPRPSSNTLIDQAEKSGALDGETALLYRVFALFGDARLPAQYRGDDSGIIDSMYLDQVVDRFETLSPTTQALVQPFLTPPAYQGSYANQAGDDVSAASILTVPPPCQFFSDRWVFRQSDKVPVKVWYPVDPDTLDADRTFAGRVITEIDNRIWPELTGLMRRAPLPDTDAKCNGGDGSLDIYLDDIERSFFQPFSSCQPPASGFIVMRRIAYFDTLTHEIFHAIQSSYNRKDCLSSDEFKWWTEGSATWSQDFVDPTDEGVHKAAPHLLSVPEKPLDLRNDKHEYGSYLFPLFLTRVEGRDAGLVRTAWESVAGKTPIEAWDAILPGGFAAVWPEFVKENWNGPPVERYKTHGMTRQAHTDTAGLLLFGTPNEDVQSMKVDLPSLSATYKHYQFYDTTSLVVFYNGATSDLTRDQVSAGDLRYRTKPVSSADRVKHIRVWALIKINGQWKSEDWTARQQVEFCRDVKAQRIEELVVIISNSDTRMVAEPFRPVGLDPLLVTSNVGCHKWTGAIVFKDPTSGLELTSLVSFQFDRTNGWRASGRQEYVFNGPCKLIPADAARGKGSQPDILQELGSLAVASLSPKQSPWFRSYRAAVSDTRKIPGDCPGNPSPVEFPVLAWWNTGQPPPLATGNPNAQFHVVSANGKLMEGFHQQGVWTWAWHLESLRDDE